MVCKFRAISSALGLACFAAVGSATGATVTTTPIPRGALVNSLAHKGLARSSPRKGYDVTPTCYSATPLYGAGPNSFVGVPTGQNIAGGDQFGGGPNNPTEFAGVLAGYGNAACSYYSGIVAGYGNAVGIADSHSQDTRWAVIGGGSQNVIQGGSNGFIGAGMENRLLEGAYSDGITSYNSAIVAGGSNSIIEPYAFVGAGDGNAIKGTAFGGGVEAFIGAGQGNAINGADSAIVGGASNSASGSYAGILAGFTNSVSGEYGAIGGGYENVASGLIATIGGGYANSASGQNATIPGGASNTASGRDSFAAGNGSRAVTSGAFVWSDNSTAATTLTSTAPNQFLARAAGGFFLYSAANLSAGVRLSPGSGSWSSLSDRASKTMIQNVDDARVLAKVASLPVSEWSYLAQGTAVRHLGPMAQDFRAAFGLGEDDRHISVVDEEGVALAAIKALQRENSAKDQEIAALRAARGADDDRVANLEKRVDALEATTRAATSESLGRR